jgi:CHAT domain-containing protein
LNDDYNLFILPSISTLQFLKEKRKPGKDNILVLGNPTNGQPDLSFAQSEAQAIARLFGTDAFIGKAAKESIVWSQANSKEILHLATHAKYNSKNPLFSSVSLAKDDKAENNKGDGRLEAHEVFGLDLTSTTNLVVLSACETQGSQVTPGSELTGLSRAFIFAGTPSVVASLWKVDDEATGLLMTAFYKYLKAGKSKVEALRMAQVETRQHYENPYYWAAFVLTGDPGN